MQKADRPKNKRALLWVVALVVFLAAMYGTVVYTEQPRFCNVCHEMTPYYSAWQAGGHQDTSCITCHVAPGVVARFSHKFVALKEVWDHFTTDPRFPRGTAEVPDDRCISCHEDRAAWDVNGFSHEKHADAGTCQLCHAATGHKVTFAALDSAGILAPGTQVAGAEYVGQIDAGQGEPSAAPGHPTVSCSQCHPMAEVQCSACHRAPADHYGADCTGCHTADIAFADTVFKHPADADCLKCHQPPASHYTTDCSACHNPDTPFAQAVFKHPRVGEHTYRSFPCVDCHPNGYASSTCTKCHEGGAPKDD